MCYNVTVYMRISKMYACANFTLCYIPCVSGWYDTVNVNI